MNHSSSLSLIHTHQDSAISTLTVGGLLQATAAAVPDRVALRTPADAAGAQLSWTYAELLHQAERSARALLTLFSPGDHVAIWAPNVPQWWHVEFGAALAGIVLVTVNTASRDDEVAYVLLNADAVGLIMVREWRSTDQVAMFGRIKAAIPKVREVILIEEWDAFLNSSLPEVALPMVQPGDPFMIQYTSGTTGKPKGARLSHRGVVNTTKFATERFGLAEGSVWLNCMPLFHTGGSVHSTLGTVWNKGTMIMPVQFEAGLFLATMEREGANWITTVPTMAIALLDHPDFGKYDYSSLQLMACGGAPVAPELVERIERNFDCEYVMISGQTEMSGMIFQSLRGDTLHHKALTIGRPLGPAEVRIADVNGATVGIGEIGEICLRSFGIMIDYYGMPEATREAIVDGWFHTGDLGTMEPDGYLTMTGRSKEMMIRGGENIYPREIEDQLLAHPDVADVAVFGIPDPYWGEQVVAAVRLFDSEPVTERELTDFLQQRMAKFKVPSRWWFVQSFPTTLSGKVQKFLLKQQFIERLAATDGARATALTVP